MTWRDEIRAVTPSFRGVPFRTTDAEALFGRRSVVHEYPQRDRPFVEDLGAQARQWVISGKVTGDDYIAQRDALMRALGEAGPGELVHPRYGVLQVCVVGAVSVQESHDNGGTATVRFTVVEAGANAFPVVRADTAAAVDAAARRSEVAAQTRFAEVVDLSGPAPVAAGAIAQATAAVNDFLAAVRQVTNIDELSALVADVTAFSDSIASLIRTPVVFAQRFQSLFDKLVSGVRRPVSALAELQAMVRNQARPVTAATAGSMRARVAAGQAAVGDLTRTLALASQARMVAVAVSAGIDPGVLRTPVANAAQATQGEPAVATAAQAVALRDLLFEQLDAEIEATEPDPQTAAALEAMRSAVAVDVTARAELLRERSTFTPATVLPALTLAHRIYQDATRVDELISRNALRHPGMVPAAALEVLR